MDSHTKNSIAAEKHDRSHGVPDEKKGGAGKANWGTVKDEMEATAKASNKNDPNYDSESEDEQVVLQETVVEAADSTTFVLKEYFFEGDLEEIKRAVEAMQSINFVKFIKKALVMGMEKKAYERELVSRLISKFYGSVIPADVLAEGFLETLKAIDDLVLDNPDGVDTLSKFIARAIVDDTLPPSFVNTPVTTEKQESVMALANGLITEPHRMDRLKHIWGAGDHHSVKRLKEEVALIVKEYVVSGDAREADAAIRKLAAPSFHFQLVKEGLRLGISKDGNTCKAVSQLLKYLYKEGLLTSEAIERGFKVTQQQLSDLQLDVPQADKIFAEQVELAKADGYLVSL